jgi:ADP-L-glycero-D-manno-heptose 6-epimerase
VCRAAGRPSDIAYVDTPLHIRRNYQYFTEARIERLRHAGYTAKFTELEKGITRYVRDFLATDDPYV